jgi:hypothetical protein
MAAKRKAAPGPKIAPISVATISMESVQIEPTRQQTLGFNPKLAKASNLRKNGLSHHSARLTCKRFGACDDDHSRQL